jgi:hypothetical protein
LQEPTVRQAKKQFWPQGLDNFIELNDYILFIKYSSLEFISKVILDNKGVILDRNFDQNITLKIRVSASTKALIEKKFPTAKIQSLV